jgi:hypothetical protein
MLAVMGRAVAGLVAALVVSCIIGMRPIGSEQLRSTVPAYLLALGAQVAHFIEEYHTGFYREFPPIFGAAPWSGKAFLVFNLLWLFVFGLAAIGLMRGLRPAFAIALFLALGGGVLNGLAHVAFAAMAGGYFPGLYTAPLVLCAGSYLAYCLLRRSSIRVAAIK